MNTDTILENISFECDIPLEALTLFKTDDQALWFWVDLDDSFLLSYDANGSIEVWERAQVM